MTSHAGNAESEASGSLSEESFFSKHFALLLNTVVSIAMAASGYFFVTVHEQRTKDLELQLGAISKQTDAFRAVVESYRIEAELKREALRLDLEARKQNLMNSKELRKWTQDLLSQDEKQVLEASTALAMGGETNIPVLIAALTTPDLPHVERVANALRIGAVQDHARVCNTLCQAAGVAGNTSTGAVAYTLQLIHCTAAADLLEQLSKHNNDPRLTAAVKELRQQPVRKPKSGYDQCVFD